MYTSTHFSIRDIKRRQEHRCCTQAIKCHVTTIPSRKILNHIRSLPQVHCYFIYFFFSFSLCSSRKSLAYMPRKSSFLLQKSRVAHILNTIAFPSTWGLFFLWQWLPTYIILLIVIWQIFLRQKPNSSFPSPTLESSKQIYKRLAHKSWNQAVTLRVSL